MQRALQILTEAWEGGVSADHCGGDLYYEEDLQGSLYHHIRCRSEEHIVHIDALKQRKEFGNLSPDIIICSPGHVDILLEVKYAPWIDVWSYGFWEKCLRDVSKLLEIAERVTNAERGTIPCSLKVDPYGQGAEHPGGVFAVDSETLYALAVITQADVQYRNRLAAQIQNKVECSTLDLDRFWLLHAWVSRGTLPTFSVQSARGSSVGDV